jgi:hypothetical protein
VYKAWGCWLRVPWFVLCFIEIEKMLYCLWNKLYNDNWDQTYLGVGIFHGKVELAI